MKRSSRSPGLERLRLDLSPPVMLNLWAMLLALGITLEMVVPAIAAIVVGATVMVSVGAVARGGLVSERWRLIAILAPLFVGAGVGIGALHSSAEDPISRLAGMEPGEVIVEGRVGSPPEASGIGYRAELRVEHLWYEGKEVLRGGGLEVYSSDLAVGVGDRVQVWGEIAEPEPGGDFDYGKYLKTEGISALLYANRVREIEGEAGWVGEVHRRATVALGRGLQPREASVVRGMVIGDRSMIPEDVQEDFRRSGITHILAISGQHVAILTAMVYFLLRLVPMPVAARAAVTLAAVWVYVIVAGMPPSALRAGVVATMVLAAPLFGRQVSPLHLMGVMLAFVLSFSPQLIFNVGFQLSVAAVFGILLLRRPLKAFIEALLRQPPRVLSEMLAISMAAQISTLPIIAASFEEVPVMGPLTNLVAIPLSGPILALGMSGAVVGNVVPTLAYPINATNGFLVWVLEWVARSVSDLPFAAVPTAGVAGYMVALFYILCVPAVTATFASAENRRVWAGGLLVSWAGLWIIFASVSGG